MRLNPFAALRGALSPRVEVLPPAAEFGAMVKSISAAPVEVYDALQSGPTNPQTSVSFAHIGINSAGMHISHERACMVAAVWACMDVIASALASSDWNVYAGVRGAANKQSLPNDSLQYILNTRFNDEMTAQAGKRAMGLAAAGYGNGYAEIEWDLSGRMVALWPISPDRVEPVRNREGLFVYRVTQDYQGGFVELDPSDVFHIRGAGMTGAVGDDIIGKAIQTIAMSVAVDQFGSAYFGNGTQLGGILEYVGRLDDAHFERTKAQWNTKHQGARQAFKTAILEGGMKFTPVTSDAEKAQMVEAKYQIIEEVCRWFRVPPHKVAHLLRCMPADTLVSTRSGPKRIADVLPGDEVWCPTQRGPVLRKVLNHWANGIRETLEIKTTNRTVRCTANHRLLVRRAHERPLNPGEIGGRNVGGSKVRIVWRDVYVQAGDLQIGDTLIALAKLPDQGRCEAPNGRKLTVGFMEFCGLFLADGNLTYTKGKPDTVCISRGDRANYMVAYRDAMETEFVRYATGGTGKSDLSALAKVTLTESGRSTRFRSVLAAGELSNLGFAGTAFTKRLPGWIFETSEPLRLAFLRGFLDGDGTVDVKGRLTYYSASKALLDDVRHLCISVGVPVTNTRSDRNGSKAFGNGTRMWRFTCSDAGANGRIGSHDARYVERLLAARAFGRKDRFYPRFGGKEFSSPGLALSRITAIELRCAEPVFDIEVEGEHCFFADGIASHNSTNNNIEHQGLEFSRDTLRPWVQEIQQEADYKLIPFRGPKKFLELDVDWAEQGDYGSRATAYSTLIGCGVLSPNDVLRKFGENTIGDKGDIRFVNGAAVRLEDVGKNMLPAKPAPAEPAGDPNAVAQAWLTSVYSRIQRRFDNGARNMQAAGHADWRERAREATKAYAVEHVDELADVLAERLAAAQHWAIEVINGCEPKVAALAVMESK